MSIRYIKVTNCGRCPFSVHLLWEEDTEILLCTRVIPPHLKIRAITPGVFPIPDECGLLFREELDNEKV